ncbi:hypothetical protein BD626DRAFT_474240 [Schizophyllum amplum]|uniref:BTB domain-containing protein n=1 Tax=Schizophyllum amplum TaxID=97359 RepID=A0A550CXF8_9AGAR|nr:hypothetical protein BD626DRAFT_474240 [Auriculariopsis ampla]
MSAMTVHSSASRPANHRFYLSDGNIKFKLDDGTLYKVHRYFFENHSSEFAADHLNGATQDIVNLPEVSSVDFNRFLALIYPTEIGERDIHTLDEWTSVLRLATKWSMSRLLALALREIEPIAGVFDKILISREFDLGETWLQLSASTGNYNMALGAGSSQGPGSGLAGATALDRMPVEQSTSRLEERLDDIKELVRELRLTSDLRDMHNVRQTSEAHDRLENLGEGIMLKLNDSNAQYSNLSSRLNRLIVKADEGSAVLLQIDANTADLRDRLLDADAKIEHSIMAANERRDEIINELAIHKDELVSSMRQFCQDLDTDAGRRHEDLRDSIEQLLLELQRSFSVG